MDKHTLINCITVVLGFIGIALLKELVSVLFILVSILSLMMNTYIAVMKYLYPNKNKSTKDEEPK